jgi:hypothetical protein
MAPPRGATATADDDGDLAQFVRDLLRDDDDEDDEGGGACDADDDGGRNARQSVWGYGGYRDGRSGGASGGDAWRGGAREGVDRDGGARVGSAVVAGDDGDGRRADGSAVDARDDRRGEGRGDDVYGQRWVRRECALGGKVNDDVGERCTEEGGVTITPADHVAGTWATPRAGAGFGISDDVEVGSEGATAVVVTTTTLSALQSTTTNPLSTKPMELMEPTNKRPGEFAAPRARRKRKSIFPEDARDFGLERLTHMLMLPAHDAAAKLGVSLTTFKHRYGVIRMCGYCLNFVARARRLARGQRNLTNGCVFFRR